MRNSMALLLNRDAYLRYLGPIVVLATSSKPANILVKSIFYRLSSKVFYAYLIAQTILYLKVYMVMRILNNATIPGFHIKSMADLMDVFYNFLLAIIGTPTIAMNRDFAVFTSDMFPCLLEFREDTDEWNKRSIGGTLVNIKPLLDQILYDSDDVELKALTVCIATLISKYSLFINF